MSDRASVDVAPARLVFVGCGLIGGSLLLRARAVWPRATLVACDTAPVLAEVAASGVADELVEPAALREVIGAADVVVVAAPLDATEAQLRVTLDAVSADAIVIDVCSVKQVVHAAVAGHPREARFVGGHPMFGSEQSGFSAARASLVEGARFLLTHTEATAADALAAAQRLVVTLGAEPVISTPGAHDAALAKVSHLPQLVASLLADLACADADAMAAAGPAFRDMTRLAASPPALWSELFAANAEAISAQASALAEALVTFDPAHPRGSERLLARARDRKLSARHLSSGPLSARVNESSTGAMLRDVARLIASGRDIVPMHVGEPRLAPSPELMEQVRAALVGAPIAYTETAGLASLRERIAELASQHTGHRYDPGSVIVTAGAKQALHLALASIVAPGDEVLVLAPAWVSFAELVRLAGGRPVMVALPDSATPSPAQALRSALAEAVTPRTRALIVNTPHNPTGAVLGEDELRALAEVVTQQGLWLLSDELYRTFAFSRAHCSPLRFVAAERAVWFDGIAKSHAMTGLRIGYAAGPRALIERMTRVASHETSCPSSVGQAAALALLRSAPEGDPELRAEVLARRTQVEAWARGLPQGALHSLDGAFYAWLDTSKLAPDESSRALCFRLLHEANVATMFGEAFGAERRLRLAYALDAETLARGLQAISALAA